MIGFCAKTYFLPGGSADDALREGAVGLCEAVRNYRPGRSLVSVVCEAVHSPLDPHRREDRHPRETAPSQRRHVAQGDGLQQGRV